MQDWGLQVPSLRCGFGEIGVLSSPDLGFRVQGLGIQDLGFKGPGCWAYDMGFLHGAWTK